MIDKAPSGAIGERVGSDIAAVGGRWALVTRPEPQAGQWVSKLRAHGVAAQALPLITIAPAPEPSAVRAMFAALLAAAPRQPLVMFVSPNAAAEFFACLRGPRERHDASGDAGAGEPPEANAAGGGDWPPGAIAAATGPGTVAALRAAGVPAAAIVAPAADALRFESEAVWALLQGQDWSGRPAWIVRGDGGRDWFADTLRSAGAELAFVQSYVRQGPQWTPERRALLARALAQPESVRWLLSSSESVSHLGALAPADTWRAATALASHPRIAASARAAGFGSVLEIRPTLAAVVEAMRS